MSDPDVPRSQATSPPPFLFWAYDLDEPSFRHRLSSVIPHLEGRGVNCIVDTLPKRHYVRRIRERREQVLSAAVLIMHRIKMSPPELLQLRRLARPVVFDVDDAIYYRRPRRLGQEPDRSWWRRFKFARTCALADLVLAGNQTLGRRAAMSADRVEVVPTPVELARYEQHPVPSKSPHTLVWIGLPENLVYLELVRPVLVRIAADFPGLSLRIISSSAPTWPELPIEAVPWSPEAEVPGLLSAGIGVMPLTDDDWTRGKCAFKLIQYMAAGLPCVGSAVGANCEVVDDGVSGFLAAGPDEWERALRALLSDQALANRMGMAGRTRVREEFDLRVVGPRVADLLEEIAAMASK